MKKVLYVRDLPLVNSLYNSGYMMAIWALTSLSNTRENTGSIVYTVAYPTIKKP